MKAIEIFNDGNILNYKYYDLVNGSKKILRSTSPTYVVLEAIENGEIYHVKRIGDDLQFNSNNTKIIIRNYNKIKDFNDISYLSKKLNYIYRKEKLKQKKLKREKLFTKATIISGVIAIGVVGLAGLSNEIKDIKNEVPPSPPKLEQKVDNILTEEPYITVEIQESAIEDNTPKVSIDFDIRTDSPKFIKAKELYGDMITKYANRYGVDPDLMIAVATHERGVHSNVIDDGGGLGLMQVQRSVWINYDLTVYNYETQSYETIQIRDDNMANLESNIQIGCAIMQDNLNRLNNNPLMALQAYNYGVNYVNDCVDAYSSANNISSAEVKEDITNTEWMKYRYIIKKGDQNYIENVLSYVGDEFKIENMRRDGIVELKVSNNTKTHTYS